MSITRETVPIRSAADVTQLVNDVGAPTRHARMIVFIAVGGVFLDAYDLTSLTYGETDVAKEFGLGSVGIGVVGLGDLLRCPLRFVSRRLAGRQDRTLPGVHGRHGVLRPRRGRCRAGPNAAILTGFRFVMGVGVGMDLPVAMAFLAEFSRLRGKRGKSDRTAAWCPATSACYLIILGLNTVLPPDHPGLLWRFVVGFGAVPALAIILVRKRYINESPSWAAEQGDLDGAARILRRTYGIDAQADPSAERTKNSAKPAGYAQLVRPPYRRRTLQNLIACIGQNFGYNSVAFGLPVIISTFLAQGDLTTIVASLALNLGFAFTGGMVGISASRRFGAWWMTLIGFGLQLVAFVTLALIGTPAATTTIVLALLMLGLYLFAQGAGREPDDLRGAELSDLITRNRGRSQPGSRRGSDCHDVVPLSCAVRGIVDGRVLGDRGSAHPGCGRVADRALGTDRSRRGRREHRTPSRRSSRPVMPVVL